jgi:hypothetical protein
LNDSIQRLKDWRIWVGSTLVLSIQALLSFNLQLHTENAFLQAAGEWTGTAGSVFIWYLPSIILAPLLVAFAPMTQLSETGWLRFMLHNAIFILGATFALQLSAITLLHFSLGINWGEPDVIAMINYFYRNTPWHADVLLILALFAMGYSLDFSQRLRRKELQAERLKAELVNAELVALKSQLNPHFLFNVLNGISGLIRIGRNDEATDSLSDLSVMLRTILENRDQELVTVKNEVEFIELYLALQQMRFRDKLAVEINVADDAVALKIPFMVLQPLVENAIQHGAQLEKEGNIINISLTREADRLTFELLNRVPQKESESGFGIGIGNNRERLNKIYGDAYSLELEPQPDRYYLTTLTIPAEECHA